MLVFGLVLPHAMLWLEKVLELPWGPLTWGFLLEQLSEMLWSVHRLDQL
jgi:hypothetical protein